MQEVCAPANAHLGLVAYSPLAGGALSGKYLELGSEMCFPGSDSHTALSVSRLLRFPGFQNHFISAPAVQATQEYLQVAESLGLPLDVLSLAFVYSRPFVLSTAVGASSVDQLKRNVQALNQPINAEAESLLHGVFRRHMDPTRGVHPSIDHNCEYVDPSKLPWGAKDQDVDPELDILINQRLSKF